MAETSQTTTLCIDIDVWVYNDEQVWLSVQMLYSFSGSTTIV